VGQDGNTGRRISTSKPPLDEIPRCYAAVVQMNGTIGDGETEPGAASLAFGCLTSMTTLKLKDYWVVCWRPAASE
jgi:hypothetical protein